NSAQNEPAPAAEPAVETTSGGKMSQEDSEKLLNSAQNEPAPAAEPALEATSGGKMSQEDIE
ncbi:MAG TPA: flagellar motor switch protein FliN, partial [Ruminococcaceae bacterium]|nr:flagellar motor switch protein FliN [Oscillospiraceae bacterium]